LIGPEIESLPMDRVRNSGLAGPRLFVAIATVFGLWACWFIYRTSFVAIDGHRYFSLFDDAMVSMRYAWNFAHGNGLVWNLGERVEGYTNLLQTLVMSGFALFLDKPTAVLGVQVLGAVVMLINGYLAVLVSRHVGLGRLENHRGMLEVFVLIGVLWYYPLAYWSLMGMETGLLTALLLLSVLLAFRVAQKGDPLRLALLSLVLGLAFLARPDSAAISVVILGYGLISFTRARSDSRSLGIGLVAVLPFVLLPIGQIVFRLSYYGNFWPNTYYLKLEGFPLTQRVRNGWAFLLPFFKENWLFLVLASLAFAHRPSREKGLLLAVGAMLIAYQIFVGGDAWRLWRLVSPGMPFLLVLFVSEILALAGVVARAYGSRAKNPRTTEPGTFAGSAPLLPADPSRARSFEMAAGMSALVLALIAFSLGTTGPDVLHLAVGQRAGLIWSAIVLAISGMVVLWRRIGKTSPTLMTSGLCLIFLASFGFLNVRFLPEMLSLDPPYQVDENRANVDTAIALLNTTTADASVGVIWAGSIPFYSGRYAIDFLGKTDSHIAHLQPELGGASRRGSMLTWPGHNKYDLEYSIGQLMPTYVQQFDWGRQHLSQLKNAAYQEGQYRGIRLWLLKASPDVLWSELAQPDS
jgi:hypothetical protein